MMKRWNPNIVLIQLTWCYDLLSQQKTSSDRYKILTLISIYSGWLYYIMLRLRRDQLWVSCLLGIQINSLCKTAEWTLKHCASVGRASAGTATTTTTTTSNSTHGTQDRNAVKPWEMWSWFSRQSSSTWTRGHCLPAGELWPRDFAADCRSSKVTAGRSSSSLYNIYLLASHRH